MYLAPMGAQFLVAAAHSGAGKTTVTLGLLRAFRRQGLRVQPFKAGPDYIDPIHHRTAAGVDSINLDGFMMSTGHIRELYARHGAGADIVLAEGVMGLFDGSRKSEGSSAALAILLDLPVILVLNAKAMAYSAAAILYGLKNFDPRLRIAGVIFNFVNSPSHYRLLQEACADVGVPALGHLPDNPALRIPSRHLGLDTANAEDAIEAAADHLSRHLDLDALLAATAVAARESAPDAPETTLGPQSPKPRTAATAPAKQAAESIAAAAAGSPSRTILIARDAGFHFLYPENLRALERWGHIEFFSPLTATSLPKDIDLLYLPGGYPELYLEQLSQNKTVITSIREHAARGGKILAECGGMMFLGREITDANGKPWPMLALLDIATTMSPKKLTLGYRSVEIEGHPLKGHEFHYSQYVGDAPANPVFFEPNLLASYQHFYWGEDPAALYHWLG
jgi:cobyrinic acid a,c-diamide synthase